MSKTSGSVNKYDFGNKINSVSFSRNTMDNLTKN